MQGISARGLWAGLLAAGAVGVAAIAVTGSAAADQERAGGGGATIKAKVEGQKLDFFGPDSIAKGEKLTIVNKTSPREIGPHTFTLVRKGKKPQERIGKAHEFDQKTGEVGRPVVESGERGWDRAFTKKHDGDSWYTEERGASHSRKVSADVGKTVRYFCAIHPFMKGEFEVTG